MTGIVRGIPQIQKNGLKETLEEEMLKESGGIATTGLHRSGIVLLVLPHFDESVEELL